MIDFPSSPGVGQQYTAPNGVTWVWDGVKWTALGAAGPQTPIAMNDNRIINGDMRIDQRNNGASGTANNGYTVDRWQYAGAQASKGAWQRITASGPLTAAIGFQNYLLFTSSSAYASAAGDAFTFHQRIEADMVTDFAFGTASAQPITLSFWAVSSLAGTFGGSIKNTAGDTLLPIYVFDPRREHLDENRRHHSRRHSRNMGDER